MRRGRGVVRGPMGQTTSPLTFTYFLALLEGLIKFQDWDAILLNVSFGKGRLDLSSKEEKLLLWY